MNTSLTANHARKWFLTAQAIPFAIAYLQGLPQEHARANDLRDLCAIARAIEPTLLVRIVEEVERTGIVLDLWPHEGQSDPERRAWLFGFESHLAGYKQQLANIAAVNPVGAGA